MKNDKNQYKSRVIDFLDFWANNLPQSVKKKCIFIDCVKIISILLTSIIERHLLGTHFIVTTATAIHTFLRPNLT